MRTSLTLVMYLLTALGGLTAPFPAKLRFEISLNHPKLNTNPTGRLFLILSPTNSPEPRLTLGRTGPDAPQALARDVAQFSTGKSAILDSSAISYPATNLSAMPPGEYYVQALFDW